MLKRNISVTILLLAFGAATVFLVLQSSSRDETKKPYGYPPETEIGKVGGTDTYIELDPIELGEDSLNCLAIGPDGKIYAAGEDSLVAFSSLGERIGAHKIEPDPVALHISEDNEILIGYENRVVSLRSDYSPAHLILLPEDSIVTSICTAGESIFVADAGAKMIWRFNNSGGLIGKFDGKHPGNEVGFIIPSPYFPVAKASSGDSIWVSDTGRHKVVNFTLGGRFISEWGTHSAEAEGFCGCCNPIRIAVAPDGTFATAEKGTPRVKTYGQSGNLIGVVAAPEDFDFECIPADLAFDREGRILVLDSSRGQIRIFRRSP